jgi:hypothetical protein
MWQEALQQTVQLCAGLAVLYGLEVPGSTQVSVDWGNGVLYDEEVTWQGYLEMVRQGLLKPEIALGWRFDMPADTPQAQQAIRQKLMPAGN